MEPRPTWLARLAPGGEIHPLSDGFVAWNRRSGRGLTLPSEPLAALAAWLPGTPVPPDLAGVARRLQDLRLLREHPPFDPIRAFPVRHRRVLSLPDRRSLWRPLPLHPAPGGHAWIEHSLSDAEWTLWHRVNGARTTEALARETGIPLVAVLAFLESLTAFDAQAIQVRDRPPSPHDASLDRFVSPPRARAHTPGEGRTPAGATDLRMYHLHSVTDASTHFDDRETTVAHAFAVPHPALGGEPYGRRMYRALRAASAWPAGGVVLEVGGGDGELGEALHTAAREEGVPARLHLALDLSPTLLRAQRARQPGTRVIHADACNLPLRDGSVDLLLANEVVADLAAVPLEPARASDPALARALARYDLPPRPGLHNLGAWRFLEEAARLLRPGGLLCITEFGETDETPEETPGLDHPEVSIRFGDLHRVATALGLTARILPMADWLGFALDTPWLSRGSWEGVRALARARDVALPARAWTLATLPLPWRVEGLREVPIHRDGPAPVVTRFHALLAKKS